MAGTGFGITKKLGALQTLKSRAKKIQPAKIEVGRLDSFSVLQNSALSGDVGIDQQLGCGAKVVDRIDVTVSGPRGVACGSPA